MKQRRFLILSAAALLSTAAFAQQKHFSGTVLDSYGEPVIGATVRVPGTQTAAVTDIDGHFTISVNPGTKLEVSYSEFSINL